MDLSPTSGVSASSLTSEPAAYTTYAFFEWGLIIFDVAFDAVTACEFSGFELRVVDVKGISKGYVRLPLYNRD